MKNTDRFPEVIRSVGHVALHVTDLDAAVDHARNVLGLHESERRPDAAYLTCGTQHHSVAYVVGDVAALDHVGLQATSDAAVEEIAARLDDRGTEHWAVSEPGIESAIRFEGPAGHVFEVYSEMTQGQPAWYPTSGLRPRRFGHVTLKADDIEPTETFLEQVLGFRVSDRVDEGLGTWMRCDRVHHSLAVMQGGNGIHHYAFDVDQIGDMERLGDLLHAHGQRFVYGPGRHGVGDNLFTYHRDANGILIECAAELERIDDPDRVPGLWPNDPEMENVWGPPPEDDNFNGWWTPLASRSTS